MNHRNYERYRRILSGVAGDHSTHLLEEPLPSADWEEQAAELHGRYIARVDEDLRWQRREAARRALARLQAGDFGRCIDCGHHIGPKRLAFVPWTERCVRCQATWEQEAASSGAAVVYFGSKAA